jgi:hypothetical protein
LTGSKRSVNKRTANEKTFRYAKIGAFQSENMNGWRNCSIAITSINDYGVGRADLDALFAEEVPEAGNGIRNKPGLLEIKRKG